jgi:uncharacterized protein (DUF1684 family)
MKNIALVGVALALAMFAAACGPATAEFDAAAHRAEVMEWREERLASLLAPTGYLAQIGLYWLEDGSYTMGSAQENDIVLPQGAAGRVAELVVDGGEARMRVENGVDVRWNEQPVTEIALPADVSGEFVMVEHGSIAWSIIERGGKLAVRIRDFNHPWLQSFGPIPYYPIDPKWRVEATLSRYDEPRQITVNTVIEGFQQFPVAPGLARFELDGIEYELEPQQSGDLLFFVFGDDTNRDETYGAGRYLYAEMPQDDGRFVLDFNRAKNPPCAFNDFSTCPVASPRNRLPIRVEAGEKFAESLHYSGAASRQPGHASEEAARAHNVSGIYR